MAATVVAPWAGGRPGGRRPGRVGALSAPGLIAWLDLTPRSPGKPPP